MSASTFDTLSAARNLEAAGIDRGHAEAIVAAIGNAGEEVATKGDLEPLATKTYVLQVAVGIVLANTTLTVALVKLL